MPEQCANDENGSVLLTQLSKDAFEEILPIDERTSVIAAQRGTVRKFGRELNLNFFTSPEYYDPYLRFLGTTHDHLNLGPDLSRPAMSALFYLSTLVGFNSARLLDYGCGLSGLIKYASKFVEVRGFDSFAQISERALSHFIATIGLEPNKVLLNIDSALLWKPNILSVCGIWVQDLALYDLESVKVLLSDPLYNSGAVAGQGVYHYDPNWKNRPEHFGFVLASRFPALDVYVRD